MACCTRYCAAEAHFGKKRAEADLERYRRQGADAVTQILLAELRRRTLQDKQLLDVGCGVGVVCAELAGAGIASATLVEASPSFIELARQELEPRYGTRPTQFVVGDFVLLAETLPVADVVIMDRVVCCYPDYKALLRAAALKTREVLALTYPHDLWYVRGAIAGENLLRRLKRDPFTVFVHSPGDMSATVESSGLIRSARRKTPAWVIDVYERNPAPRGSS